jgi:hypothetical protein
MSYNGSGTFVVNSTGQPVVTGTVISSTAFNALTADLATGLSTAITKDGQTTTTARILFAQGVSSTLVTDATSATTGSIITAGGISMQKALWVGTTSRHVGAATFDAAITYGGVTLSNSVTGTGSMVLSANAVLTGLTSANALDSINGNVSAGNPALRIGADLNATTRTNATRKLGLIGGYHYTNTEEAVGLIAYDSNTSDSRMLIGGGATGFNAATAIEFYTAANTTTTTGTLRATLSSAGAWTWSAYGSGAITSDASGNLTSVSDPSQKIITGDFKAGLKEVVAAASPEFMGLHKWTKESGMETEGEYASFFARDSFPIPHAVAKNPKTGINSFSDRPVVMALVNAVAELTTRLAALENK